MDNKCIFKSSTSLAIKEMQIKTTIRFHLISQNGNNQENKQQILARIQEKRNPHTLLEEMLISAATMEINMKLPQ
jgi:hypothetical protein